MTVSKEASRVPRGTTARRWTRRRATHATTVLRRLRFGVLAMVAVTALLYLMVSAQAGRQITAAQHTEKAVHDLREARNEAARADEALKKAADTGQVALIGPGADFGNATARVNSLVTAATAGNADGRLGLMQIQFVQGQLATLVQQAETAARDFAVSREKGMENARKALTAPREPNPRTHQGIPYTGGLQASLADLQRQEQNALDRRRTSGWLDPALLWSLLVGPAAVMSVLVAATAYVVARHFRRYVSPWLPLSLLFTAGVGVATGVLCRSAANHPGGQTPFAAPVTTVGALLLLAGAAAAAYVAYQPRLAEYRFPHS